MENAWPLTTRELGVLRAARSGVTVAEIADEFHLVAGTVRTTTILGRSGSWPSLTRHAAAPRGWEEGWI